ncbi:MAG: RnfH family protein [Pseudomonadota bacterium]
MHIEVIRAWPRRHESMMLALPEGATVADALAAAAAAFPQQETPAAVAIHGERAALDQPLREGDRVELLRPLLLDPKEARRRRAGK